MKLELSLPTAHQVAVVGTHLAVGASAVVGTAAYFGALAPTDAQRAGGAISHIVADVEDLALQISVLTATAATAFAWIKSGPVGSFLRAAAAIYSSRALQVQAQAAATPEQAEKVASVAQTVAKG